MVDSKPICPVSLQIKCFSQQGGIGDANQASDR